MASRSPAQPADANKQLILVIDDTESNRLLLRAFLTRAGYGVLCAESGSEGIALLQQQRVSLVILDYMMPQMNGADVLLQLRSSPSTQDIPVLVLTASQDETHIREAFAAGADDFTTKPVDQRVLTARVQAMIRAAEDRRKLRTAAEMHQQHEVLLDELREAASVQKARLPNLPAQSEGWAITGALVPSRLIGGDALDIIARADGSRVLALIDVSGHGLAAAIVASSVTIHLRSLLATHGLVEALQLLNWQLYEDRSEHYACIGLVELSPKGVLVVNAGLPPICLITANGELKKTFEAAGLPPGLLADAVYDSENAPTEAGDCIVLVSDGLTEPFGACDAVVPALQQLKVRDLTSEPACEPHIKDPRVWSQRISDLQARLGLHDPDDATILIAARSC